MGLLSLVGASLILGAAAWVALSKPGPPSTPSQAQEPLLGDVVIDMSTRDGLKPDDLAPSSPDRSDRSSKRASSSPPLSPLDLPP